MLLLSLNSSVALSKTLRPTTVTVEVECLLCHGSADFPGRSTSLLQQKSLY